MKLRISPIAAGAALAALLAPDALFASSHREAPFITKNPKLDGTDFYAFNSYETGRAGYVTLIANYLPLQDAYGGPNYFSLDPEAIYEIHVDNNGDAIEDITFQFDFESALQGGNGFALDVGPNGSTKSVGVPFSVFAPISAGDNSGQNVLDTYKVNVIRGPRRTGTPAPIKQDGTNATTFKKPFDNVGAKSFAPGGYAAYANAFKFDIDIPGCTPAGVDPNTRSRMFVGQRRETFSVNLGQIFDLVNFTTIDNQPEANVIGAQDQGKNIVGDKNVTTIALEVPASCLVSGGSTIIGAWTTSSIRQARVINPTATFTQPAREGGPFVQVSRLGMPLVNEVIIGLKDKDRFNGSEPKDDAQFADYVTNPTLPEILELLFGATTPVRAPNNFPRTDLVQAFLTGIPSVNLNGATAEYLRLNTAIPPTPVTGNALNPGGQSSLGAAGCFDPPDATNGAALDLTNVGCDPAGFPNGRRPGDDVVDIELRVAMGFLVNTTDAPAGQLPYVDGAGQSQADADATFPYLKTPFPGSP